MNICKAVKCWCLISNINLIILNMQCCGFYLSLIEVTMQTRALKGTWVNTCFIIKRLEDLKCAEYCLGPKVSLGRNVFSYKVVRSSSSTQASPDKFGGVSAYSLACLARELLSKQGRLIYNKQRHLLKQNLSETITQIVNSCMLSFNPSVDPVVC